MKRACFLALLLLTMVTVSACGEPTNRDGQLSVPDPTDAPEGVPTVFMPSPVPSWSIPPPLPSVGPVGDNTPTPLEPDITPLPTDTPSPQAPYATETPIVIQPESQRVEIGKSYPFSLYTHCGVDFSTDFDGSYWDAPGYVPDRTVLGDPVQRGTMTLIDADHARFDFDGGSILFTRHKGPKTIPGFCA